MIDRLVGGNALPALERALQFSGARQHVIANNIANIETPGFRPMDVSVEGFEAALRESLDKRQEARASGLDEIVATASDGGIALDNDDEIELTDNGMVLKPTPIGDGILYHDGNDRSLERILQSLTENLMQFRFATTLVRRHFALLDAAIRERP